MKQNLYKIIALISVLLGALGPQVASGQVAEVNANTKSTFQSVDILVVSQPANQTTIQTSSSAGTTCITAGSDRLDLLLWQGCNDLAIAPEPVLPNLAIVTQPVNMPDLVVQHKINFQSPIALNPAPLQENPIVFGNIFSVKQNNSVISQLVSVESKVMSQNSIINSFNQVSTVVLRC